MDIEKIKKQLSLEEKLTLLTGFDGLSALRLPERGLEGVQMADGPYGVKTATGSVCYPNTCLMACSWDREICREIGGMLGADCVNAGVELLLSPAINIKRTPLAGRNFEYYSEDPVLTGELACAYVEGLKEQGMAVCAKHYACNNQEKGRWTYNSCVDDDTLRNLYLKAFEIVLSKGNVDSVMASYNQINGEYGCQNSYLLQTILREEWGYRGVVMSDWCACADIVESFRNGLDLEMPANPPHTVPLLAEAVREGRITEAQIDEKLDRLLQLYRDIKKAPRSTKAVGDREEKIRRLTGECFVLLKNEGVLPLRQGEKVLLVGGGARCAKVQGGGCAKLKTNVELSPYAEILKYDANAVCVDAFNAEIEGVEGYDKVLVFLTLPESSDSESGDREDFAFPAEQVDRLLRLARRNPNVVAVLQNGSPVDTSFAPYVKGILETYYAGSYGGGALADVLYGKVSPAGKLAESLPMRYEDTPAKTEAGDGDIYYREREFVGYRYYTSFGVKPRFPFGFGLSYADIAVENEQIIRTGEHSFRISCLLRNRSPITGKQTVQIYLKSNDPFQPKMRLLQFATERVPANGQKEVNIELTEKDLSFYVCGRKKPIYGKYSLCIATSSEELRAEWGYAFKKKEREEFTRQTTLGKLLLNEKYRALTLEYMRGAILDWAYGVNAEGKEVTDVEAHPFLQDSVYNMPIRSFTYCHAGGFTMEKEREFLERLNALEK